jgi:hypothetical protein
MDNLHSVIAVSLPMLGVLALLVSAVVTGLNARGMGVVASAGVMLVACVAVAMLQGFVLGSIGSIPQAIRMWVVFVFLPAAAVLAVSRLGLLRTKPWLLLLLGPISFITALIVVMIVHNILFASGHSRLLEAVLR